MAPWRPSHARLQSCHFNILRKRQTGKREGKENEPKTVQPVPYKPVLQVEKSRSGWQNFGQTKIQISSGDCLTARNSTGTCQKDTSIDWISFALKERQQRQPNTFSILAKNCQTRMDQTCKCKQETAVPVFARVARRGRATGQNKRCLFAFGTAAAVLQSPKFKFSSGSLLLFF